ncbi:MAG: hypothetical protein Ct9H300mP32_0340 [Verrucomicrobiota bacterium]|nr:MAG: hypothetical protein Ct9H300mP32_0340 [Verrucomicrobiota bacterium]
MVVAVPIVGDVVARVTVGRQLSLPQPPAWSPTAKRCRQRVDWPVTLASSSVATPLSVRVIVVVSGGLAAFEVGGQAHFAATVACFGRVAQLRLTRSRRFLCGGQRRTRTFCGRS